MSRYVSVIFACDHIGAFGRLCETKAAGPDDNIADELATSEGWLIRDGKHYCPAHRERPKA